MKLPNKITSYSESVLSKIPIVMKILSEHELTPFHLYSSAKKHFKNIEEFIDVLDCLFWLKKLDYDENRGVLHVI